MWGTPELKQLECELFKYPKVSMDHLHVFAHSHAPSGATFLTVGVITQQLTMALPPPPLHTQPLQLTCLLTQQPPGNKIQSSNSATSHKMGPNESFGPWEGFFMFF